MCIDVDLVIRMLEQAVEDLKQARNVDKLGGLTKEEQAKYAEWKAVLAVKAVDWVCEHMKGVKLWSGEIDRDALVNSL